VQKNRILEGEKRHMKKSYEALLKKIKKIETENILIPKNKDKEGTASASTSEDETSDNEDMMTKQSNALIEEIRTLHEQVKHNKAVIKEVNTALTRPE
jgi:gas vesicle protein